MSRGKSQAAAWSCGLLMLAGRFPASRFHTGNTIARVREPDVRQREDAGRHAAISGERFDAAQFVYYFARGRDVDWRELETHVLEDFGEDAAEPDGITQGPTVSDLQASACISGGRPPLCCALSRIDAHHFSPNGRISLSNVQALRGCR